ncbi:hypothetical protein ACOWPH_15230 [Anabaena sp. PCC 7938]|uniref:hypothetical protein n=1 Tax=Anabaena sp. PCC 7938 TaxID=1296340 RepID=UPI000315F9A5
MFSLKEYGLNEPQRRKGREVKKERKKEEDRFVDWVEARNPTYKKMATVLVLLTNFTFYQNSLFSKVQNMRK